MKELLLQNIGCTSCLVMAVFMLILALFFHIKKDKAARYISGFSSYPKDKQKMYDLKKMSLDMRNLYLQLSLITIIGALLSLIHQAFAILAFIVWIIRFFKEVHLDDEKAFSKYKIDEK